MCRASNTSFQCGVFLASVGDMEAWDVEGETGVSVLLPLCLHEEALGAPTHGGQLCLVLVGIKSIMPEGNGLFFFILPPFAWLDSSHLPGLGMDSKNDTESLTGLCLGVLASMWGLLGVGTPGQPAGHLGQVAPMAKRGRGEGQMPGSGQGALATPSHVSFSPRVTRGNGLLLHFTHEHARAIPFSCRSDGW